MLGPARRIWFRNVPDDDLVSRMWNLPASSTQISACPRETTLLLNAILAGSCGVPRAAFALPAPAAPCRSVKRPMRIMANGARSRSIGSKCNERDDSRCGTRRILNVSPDEDAPGTPNDVEAPALDSVVPRSGGFGKDVVAASSGKPACCDALLLVLGRFSEVDAAPAPPAAAAAIATDPCGTGGCEALRRCRLFPRELSPLCWFETVAVAVLEFRFESDRLNAGKPYPLLVDRSFPPLGEGGISCDGEAVRLVPETFGPGLRPVTDEVVHPRGRRAMKPRLRLNRFEDEVEGEPGVRGCEPDVGEASPGEAAGWFEVPTALSAVVDAAGDLDDALAEANVGTLVAGGVPAGDALLLVDAELACCWVKWRGSESAGTFGGGSASMPTGQGEGGSSLTRSCIGRQGGGSRPEFGPGIGSGRTRRRARAFLLDCLSA